MNPFETEVTKPNNLFKLVLNLESGTPTIKLVEAYNTPDGDYIVPSLNTKFTFKELSTKTGTFLYEAIYKDGNLVVLIVDRLKTPSGVIELSALPNNKLTNYLTLTVGYILKTLLYDLQQLFNETHSTQVGEQLNQLVKLYYTYVTH